MEVFLKVEVEVGHAQRDALLPASILFSLLESQEITEEIREEMFLTRFSWKGETLIL